MMALPDGQYEDIDLASDIVLQTYQDLLNENFTLQCKHVHTQE
jgi:hypothetical protein